MHLNFVNSDGLEQSALSVLAESSKRSSSVMNMEEEGYSSDGDGFLIIDENSPLLLDLDPPGTRTSYMEEHKKRLNAKSLLSFKIRRRTRNEGLPWVIIFTALGMAAMVIIGFMTMIPNSTSGDVAVIPVNDKIPSNVENDNAITLGTSSPVPTLLPEILAEKVN